MASEEVIVKRALLLPCMSCHLCHKLMRDATTIIECLHSFCSKCIYQKLDDEGSKVCPDCGVDLGGAPLDKLRPDHNLQELIGKTFPKKKSVEVKTAEVVIPAAAESPKRREKSRSLSSLVISSPKFQTTVGVKGRRTIPATTKKQSGTKFTQNKFTDNDSESSDDYRQERSTSPETVNKYTRRMRRNLDASGSSSVDPTPDMARGNQKSKWQAGASKPSKPIAAGPSADNKEGRQNMTKTDIEKNARGDAPPEPKCPTKGRRVHRKSKNFGDIKMPLRPAELNTSTLKPDQINRPIWFSLIASDEKKGKSGFAQAQPIYIRIKDVGVPACFIQKYLKAKLGLQSENEVEITCAGQPVEPTMPLNKLLESWLDTLTTERVSVTIGSSAKDFVMPIHYTRRVQ